MAVLGSDILRNPTQLRSKLVLLSALITLGTAAVMAAMSYSELRKTAYDAAYDKLRFAARFHAQQLLEVIDQTRIDAHMLAGMPPISGIIRTDRDAAGIDPMDGSSAAQWRTRLEDIFAQMSMDRPHYTQLRFIGRADNWHEIVRVDMTEGRTFRVSSDQLQAKGREPYIAEFTTMERGAGRFSDVTYNREHGQITGPPTIRYVQPVIDDSGVVFGAVVINADFTALLAQAAVLEHPGLSVHAFTQAGDYMRLGTSAGAGALKFHQDSDYTIPTFAAALTGGHVPGEMVEHDGNVLFFDRLTIDDGRGLGLSVVTSMSRDVLLADAAVALWRLLMAAIVLVLLSAVVAAAIGGRLTRPILHLAQAVRGHRRDQPLDIVATSRDEVGEMTEAFIGLCNDVLAETARSRAILDGAAEAIVTVTQEGLIEEANPAACRLFGLDPSELSGQPLSILDAGLQAAGLSQAIAAARAGASMSECMARRSNGDTVPIDVSVSQTGSGDGARMIVIMRDISVRRVAEQKVEGLIQALERSNGELDKFAYIASHDLKAPLRVIDNASRWLEEDLADHLDEETRENLGLIRTRVIRMEGLLDDLLAHSRIGRDEQVSAVISGAALRETLNELGHVTAGITVQFSDRFDAISVPAMPITTVLLNLMNNAIKHHDKPVGKVRVDAVPVSGGVEFLVEDDGPGIPEKYRSKVFEMFQTLKPRDQVDGSGMGLAMVQKYVDHAGGTITLGEAPGGGAAFRMFWPLTTAKRTTGSKAA
ncbi:MAG: hypothetical protein CML02_21785 [Pseudooceanicola sp.]|jgi:PAS domain S-box-containing protein|nr:hypothetical protein [Pseudooceanicola sp.]